MWGWGGLCGSLGLRVWAGASPSISGGGLGLGGPCSLSLRHLAYLPLPPAPAWPVQPHKALFMAGGWPGAPEGGWGRRGGSCTRGQGTSGSVRGRPRRHHPALWGWTLGRSGLLPPPLPSCWPAPSPGPSFPARLLLTPATSNEAEGEQGAERGPRAGWAGAGGLGSPRDGLKLPPDDRHCHLDGPEDTSTPSTQCLDYLFRTPKLYSSLHIG